MANEIDCCKPKKESSGFIQGILYGLLPHSFCIAFIVLSIVGATAGTAIFRRLLLTPLFFPFFQFLIILSAVFATVSAIIYLKRNGLLSLEGAKRKWKYLLILYGTTIGVNLMFFMVIFPKMANMDLTSSRQKVLSQSLRVVETTLSVDIPCSGHSALIIGDLKKLDGVREVKFKPPNLFEITYVPETITPQRLLSLEVFKTYKASIVN